MKSLLHRLLVYSSGLIFLLLSCSFFWTDLELGGTLLFPIDDKKSRKKGQDLVRMRSAFLFCSIHMLLKLCEMSLMFYSQ